MSRFVTSRATSLRLMLLVGLVIGLVVPAHSRVSAQAASAPLWVVRSFYPSEYGVQEPKGLAFSSSANSLLILDGSATITKIAMGEENAGTWGLSEAPEDALNAAFDSRTGSLFLLNRGKSELAKVMADASAPAARFALEAYGLKDPQGIALDPGDGRLFILDAGAAELVSVIPHATLGFDAEQARRSNQVQRISLEKLGAGVFKGLAYNPGNGHLYISDPGQKRLYELTQSGDLVASYDLASLGIDNPSAITFAPSADSTDDPGVYDLFLLHAGAVSSKQNETSGSQIVELSFVAPAALPPGITPLPTTLVHVIHTSKGVWNPSAPDPSGVDYWPATGGLLISDSEVDEMPAYFQGKNVFRSTLSGALVGTCSTTLFTNEPTGVAINPANNHIFFSTDYQDSIFEVSLGADGTYCTADDVVTTTNISSLYGINDAEDVAYGNNTIFIADGIGAEVYRIPLGANGILGGGDDGAMAHFDTASLGFNSLEGLGYNATNGTLLVLSPQNNEKYLGEMTTTGTLLRAYDLAYSELVHAEDVTYAPSSQNPAVKNLYIAARGVDNDTDPTENDGKVLEISLGGSPTPPGAATLVSPSGTTTDTTPTYTWNNVNASTWYYLWISRVNADGTLTTIRAQWYQSSAVCGASTCSVTPAGVTLALGNYRWWIQTWNEVGYGPWSSPRNFNVQAMPPPGAATLVSPSGTTTDTTPTYVWNRVNASTWYYLWINRVNSDGTHTRIHTTWYPSSQVCGATSCSITPSVTLSAGNYRWWIQTWNDGGYGPWSSHRDFTVSP